MSFLGYFFSDIPDKRTIKCRFCSGTGCNKCGLSGISINEINKDKIKEVKQ